MPLVSFKETFREKFLDDPKFQPFADKDLSSVYTNKTLLKSELASSALCQMWLLEFLITLTMRPV